MASSLNRRWLRRLAVLFAALVLLLLGGAWFVGGALVAPANRAVGPAPLGLPVESVAFLSESGATLSAWQIPAERATATVVLLHPIRGDRRSMLERAQLFYEQGYTTLLVDLQAHGESAGEQISAGHLERHDVAAAVNFVRSRNSDHRIGIVGYSLGGAATLLAMPLDVDAVVLEAVYPTISQAVHNRISMRVGPLHHVLAPALLMQLKPRLGVSPNQLRPIDRIADVGCPVLIAGGGKDRHTTLAETEALYTAARDPKKLVVFKDATHTDLLKFDRSQYINEIASFLEIHLQPNLMTERTAD